MPVPRIIHVQFAIAIILAAGIPFAGRYLPNTLTLDSMNAVISGNIANDPHYAFRVVMISLGMLLSVISLTLAVISLFRKDVTVGQRLLMLVLSLIIFNIGWRLYPFYANGLMQIFGDGRTSSGFDPKDLYPCNTFEMIWPLVVMLFYLFMILIIPVLIIIHLIIAYLKRVAGKTELLIIIVYLLNYAFIWLTPQYLYWFFD